MMNFTLGIAIIAFTAIVGSYQYIQNVELIARKERGLIEAERKKEKYIRIQSRAKQIPQTSLVAGDDKKNTIERMLNIGEPNLSFNFIGQPLRDNNAPVIIRHSYRIQGKTDFMSLLQTLHTMRTLPGFTVTRICYGCGNARDLAENEKPVMLDGYLYVYDPTKL